MSVAAIRHDRMGYPFFAGGTGALGPGSYTPNLMPPPLRRVKPGTIAVQTRAEGAGVGFLAAEKATGTLLAIVAEKLESALHANPDPTLRTWQGLWDRYDDNGDKRLDVKEFVKMMRHATDADPPGLAIDRKTVPDDELRQIWTTADKDRSGTLVFQEFADFLAVCQEAHGKEFIATKIHRGPKK